MAMQAVGGIAYPEKPWHGHAVSGTTSYTALALSAAAHKVACILYVPKTGTLDGVGFRLGTVAVGDTLKVSFQDVDAATGDADGTADQYRTVTIGDADDNEWIDHSTVPSLGLMTHNGTDGGTKRSVTAGQKLCVVFEFNSYVAGNLSINGITAAANRGFSIGTNRVRLFTSAWAGQSAVMPCLALRYSDGTYAYLDGVWPAATMTSLTFNSGTVAQDEVGLRFSYPFRAEINGVWFFANSITTDMQIVLYASDGSQWEALTIDKDEVSTSGIACYARFASEYLIEPGVFYRIVYKPGTNNCVAPYSTFNSTDIMAQISGGANCHWTQRADGGVWSEQTTWRPYLGPVISKLGDETAGGGGLHVGSGMTGGMRG